jgi:hypothetical protein
LAVRNEPNDLKLLRPVDATPLDDSAASLARQLEAERVERKQERFFLTMGLIAMFDCLMATCLPWYGFTMITIFSVIATVGLAKWWQVPWVVAYLDLWIDKLLAPANTSGEIESDKP